MERTSRRDAHSCEADNPAAHCGNCEPCSPVGTATGLTDSELLDQYNARRAESADAATAAEMAFAALVDRHGAMVWGVCRRVLGDVHEAEDAFQATFLVLVRKAGSVRVNGSLGRWLYGGRPSRRASSAVRGRATRDPGSAGSPERRADDPVGEVELRDLAHAVGEELDRLPAKYRCPVELCHLQGMTYDQAARQLNWPVATVKSRLTKGRLRLRAEAHAARARRRRGRSRIDHGTHRSCPRGRSTRARSIDGPCGNCARHRRVPGGGH